MTSPEGALSALAAATYGQTLEAMPDAVVVVTAEGRILFVNQQTELLFGYGRQELLGEAVEVLLPARFRAGHVAKRVGYVEAPRVRPMGAGLELFGVRKDGREVPVEISLSPSALGEDLVVISTIRDVSERKAVEARLRMQTDLIGLAHDAVIVREVGGRILEWNSGAEALYGWTAAEAQGEMTHALLQTAFPVSLGELESRLAEGGAWEGELRHMTRDGREVIVESRQVLVRDRAGQPTAVLEVNRDVTVRRQMEAERDRLVGQLQAIQTVTDAALANLGIEALLPELLGRVRDVLEVDTVTILLLDAGGEELIARAALGIEEEVEQGVRVPVGQGFAGRVAVERQAVVIEDIEQAEVVNPLLAARGIRSLLGVPLLVEGQLLGVLHVGSFRRRDFTVEERELLQRVADRAGLALDRAQLYAEAREALRVRNEFLSAITHDLGNPVAAIRMESRSLQQLEAVRHGDEELFDGLAQIEATAGRMWRQVEELLDLARLQLGHELELNWQPVDLAQTLREMVATQQGTTDRHTFRLEVEERELTGEWDRTRLERVLTNVLANAVKYSPDGGEITVGARREADSSQPGGWVAIEVRDHGIGIPADDLPHIFERFHRASNVRGRFAGTGIGLAGAREIVRLHGGEVMVTSEQEVGTTVAIRLPAGEPGC
jgi:PAS domain S-box-containing protein